jgi:hypothetical protein
MKGLIAIAVTPVLIFFGLGKFFETRIESVVLISPVASITTTPEITPTPTASPTAILTEKPKPKLTKKPVPTPTSEPRELVNRLIEKYSIEYGLDPNIFRHLVVCESGVNSSAKNGPYVGLFQYDLQTWEKIRREMGLSIGGDLRYSAEESIRTTAYALTKGRQKLWPNCIP